MAKLNWHPWMGLGDLRQRMDQLADEIINRHPQADGDKAYIWQPRADMVETPDEVVVSVELPGVRLADVQVESRQRELWIFGERRFEKDARDQSVYHALERSYGPFARRFPLPKGVERSGIRAELRDGVLTVTLPKKLPPEPRRIPIDLG